MRETRALRSEIEADGDSGTADGNSGDGSREISGLKAGATWSFESSVCLYSER